MMLGNAMCSAPACRASYSSSAAISDSETLPRAVFRTRSKSFVPSRQAARIRDFYRPGDDKVVYVKRLGEIG